MIDVETWANSHTLSQIIIYGVVTTGIELADFHFITGPSRNNISGICFKTIPSGLMMGKGNR